MENHTIDPFVAYRFTNDLITACREQSYQACKTKTENGAINIEEIERLCRQKVSDADQFLTTSFYHLAPFSTSRYYANWVSSFSRQVMNDLGCVEGEVQDQKAQKQQPAGLAKRVMNIAPLAIFGLATMGMIGGAMLLPHLTGIRVAVGLTTAVTSFIVYSSRNLIFPPSDYTG